MHTSTLLCANDFTYARVTSSLLTPIPFLTFCPHYHALERVGIAAPYMEEALRHTGYALLALTTAFYDALRAQKKAFFDYPQHFALLDIQRQEVRVRPGRIAFSQSAVGSPWGGLDVWPESNWIAASGTAAGMLYAAFAHQITRLFWPYDFHSTADAPLGQLPQYVYKLLCTRLHTVYYYNSPTPNVMVRVTPVVEEIMRKSLERLPDDLAVSSSLLPGTTADQAFPYSACYEQVSGTAFLTTLSGCFEKAA